LISVHRNIFLSTLAFWAMHVARAGQQILWVPLFLAAFGKEGYGEWLALFGLVGYASMTDLGVQVYWLNLLTGAHVRGEIDQYRKTFRAGVFTFLSMSLLTMIASLAFSVFEGPTRFLELEIIPPFTASAAFVVLITSSLLAVLSQMLRGVYRTVGENPKFIGFGVVRETIIFICVALALLAHLGPLGISLVYITIAVAMIGWVLISIQSRFSHLADYRFSQVDKSTVFGLVGGGAINLAGLLATLLLVQGTLIITKWALGAAAVALVATSRTLANVALQVGGAVFSATLPEFSRLEASNDKVAMGKLLRRSMSTTFLLSGITCIVLVGLGPSLFDLWTGSRFTGALPIIYLFAGSVMVDTIRQPIRMFLLGCNRIVWSSLPDTAYAVSSLALMWFLFPRFGLIAVPSAIILSGVLVHLPIIALASARILGASMIWSLLAKSGMGLVVLSVSLTSAALAVICDQTTTAVLLYTGAGLVFFVVLFWITILNRSDANSIKNYMLNITARLMQLKGGLKNS